MQRNPVLSRPPKGPSSYRVQTYDLKWALAGTADRAAAAEESRIAAEAHPDDVRRVVLAHTLAAFARPTAARLLPILLRPFAYGLFHAGCLIALILGRFVLDGPSWVVLAGVLVLRLPRLAVTRLLRKARRAAGTWPRDDFAAALEPDTASASGLPPVPRYSRREVTHALIPLGLVVVSVIGSSAWAYARYLEYPRYEIAAPATLSGMTPAAAGPLKEMADLLPDTISFGEPFAFAYTEDDDENRGIVVYGGTADLHDVGEDLVGINRRVIAASRDARVIDVWRPGPGAFGGWMECFSAEGISAVWHQCTWADKGSTGSVIIRKAALSRDQVSDLARTTREAVLHRR
ncbi:hypothetical protein OHS33_01890 [Streptomyces sp. NBC_00536]|uniref:hypothetical protein n=1 Tax=Streptomyces sp. NBC_00536 TaxID=2975769 RepID=UPI002E80CCA5|nr:hypothetical protein [Streptomyces sp. NBC_00536]WUC77211.1 hypothetical protein OHS33_01890 [Streptomyces sp. NBC_00536]